MPTNEIFIPAYTPFKLGDGERRWRIFLIVLGLVFIAIWGVYFYLSTRSSLQINYSSTVAATKYKEDVPDTIVYVKTSTTTYKPSPQYAAVSGKVMKYTSPQLGLEFMYLTDERELGRNTETPTPMFVSRSGSRVCISSSPGQDINDCTGDTIEVYNKDKRQSLSQAIETFFLANYKGDCQVKVEKKGTYEVGFVSARSAKCPVKYASTNGSKYFRMDTSTPGKLIFISLGNYSILSDANYTPWTATLRLSGEGL